MQVSRDDKMRQVRDDYFSYFAFILTSPSQDLGFGLTTKDGFSQRSAPAFLASGSFSVQRFPGTRSIARGLLDDSPATRDFITPTWPTSPSNSGLLRQFSLGKVQKDFCFSRYSGGFRYLPYLKPKIFQSPISNTMNMGPNFLWVLLLELEAKRQL